MIKLKKYFLITFILILLITSSVPVLAQEFSEEFFTELANAVNKVPEIENPDYERLKLKNGMTFYLAEDQSLPIFEIKAYIDGGKIDENKNNAGITSLMTEVMQLATENYNESELSRYKELNALSLNISAASDRLHLSGNSLNTESTELIELMAEVLIRPRFSGSHFERTVKEYQQLYRQQFYNDSALLNMYFFKNLYGEHPYGYNYDYDLILKFLNTADSAAVDGFYQKIVNPKDIVVAVSGDFDLAEIKEELKSNFADWENSERDLNREHVDVNTELHNKIIVVNKEDATQANMRMGYNFYSSKYHKRIPFLMGNRIFGGGSFNSRLMENLRSDKGYVYGINAQTNYNDYGGLYYINLSLAPDRALDGMKAVKNEIEKVKDYEQPFSEDELFENINLYNAVFPRAYKNQIEILDELVYQIELYGESEQYINNFIKQYNGLDVEEVQRIFAEELYPDILFTVIVGPKDKILPEFKEVGIEVEVIE